MNESNRIEEEVRAYYGKELQASSDLKTDACCTTVDYPHSIKDALANIHEEVIGRYYGCGLTIPAAIEGLDVLDLGSGSGRDCYLLSQLVGETGSVTGIDMTSEQLDVAIRHLSWHQEKFGYDRSNVNFVKGNIQDLAAAGLDSARFDLIVSNCVVNLATDKEAVLSEAFRVLKEGGEFYFSDVYCDRRLPAALATDRELYGECLGGALYWNDFHNLAARAGFIDPRLVESHPIAIENELLAQKLEGFHFYSATYRLVKLQELEPACEDYGLSVRYLGGVEGQSSHFILDDQHEFERGKLVPVCGNTQLMLSLTRFRKFFEFHGSFDVHYGIFPGCGTEIPFQSSAVETSNPGAASCC